MTEQASWIDDVDRGVLDKARPDGQPVRVADPIRTSVPLESVVDRRVA